MGELDRIGERKYSELIKLLKSYSIDPNNEDAEIPSNKEIAQKLSFSQAKTNNLLIQLLIDITRDFHFKPLIIKDYVHQIHIHIPYKEQNRLLNKNKNADKELIRQFTWVCAKLPFTPRIGEEIRLDFIHDAPYTSGYVYNVRHELNGYKQIIYIEVHPFNNYYHQWQNLKEEYEYDINAKPIKTF
jgi:hypothetical protein